MKIMEHAAARIAMAHKCGRPPLKWIVTDAVAAELGLGDRLHDVPIERGETRFRLELVCARPE